MFNCLRISNDIKILYTRMRKCDVCFEWKVGSVGMADLYLNGSRMNVGVCDEMGLVSFWFGDC